MGGARKDGKGWGVGRVECWESAEGVRISSENLSQISSQISWAGTASELVNSSRSSSRSSSRTHPELIPISPRSRPDLVGILIQNSPRSRPKFVRILTQNSPRSRPALMQILMQNLMGELPMGQRASGGSRTIARGRPSSSETMAAASSSRLRGSPDVPCRALASSG